MKILILNHSEVEQLLPMPDCVEVMESALASLARGEMYQPLRMVVRPPDAAGLMALMPAYRAGQPASFGLKAICVFPENPRKGKDAHQGSVLLFDGETGEMLALMNASAITAIRTAAVSAVATRLLARDNAGELAIIGSGVQARTHLSAMACVRAIKKARVVSLTPEHARRFADEASSSYPFPVEAVTTVAKAIKDADVIVTVTTAHEPILRREWLSPGTHINAVGTYSSTAREIDSATMVAASVFVDCRESALHEAGDYLLAVREGVIGPDHLRAELGEVLLGTKPGRQSKDEITLFKSLGLAIEDLAAAEYLFDRAQSRGGGTWIEF